MAEFHSIAALKIAKWVDELDNDEAMIFAGLANGLRNGHPDPARLFHAALDLAKRHWIGDRLTLEDIVSLERVKPEATGA